MQRRKRWEKFCNEKYQRLNLPARPHGPKINLHRSPTLPKFRAMTYTVHVFGLGEVCRVPSAYYIQAHQAYNAYALAGYPVILFRDGVVMRSYAA